MHYTIFQLHCFVLLNNHQYNCNITKSFLSAATLYCGRVDCNTMSMDCPQATEKQGRQIRIYPK